MPPTSGRSTSSRVARRRHLAILFCDLSDSTTLAGAIEPERYLEILDHLKACADTIVSKHGGTIIDFHGDGFLAMFGYPEPGEFDARSATYAALEIHDAIRRSPGAMPGRGLPPLSLHSGIHSGLVLLIEGDPAPGRFSLIGETPNVAARLSDAAGRDEILVSATTLGTERFFETRARGHLVLQGKGEAVATYQVTGRASVTTRYEARTLGGLTPLVGRDDALLTLDRALAEAMAGRAQSVSIVAPPGLGKTRLAEEFLRRAATLGCDIHRGYCESYLSAEPLQPFVQMLRTLSRDDQEASAVHHAELARALHATGVGAGAASPTASADDSTIALCGLIIALAQHRPVVLFVDDWQWADEASQRVVNAVREHGQLRLLILIASRTPRETDAALRVGEVIELEPFGPADTANTIRTLLADADPFVVSEIQDLSGGNPLFIEELCHGAARDRPRAPVVTTKDNTAWLNTLIESRVARLPAAQSDLVRLAAAIGNVVPVWLFEALTGYAADHPEVRALAQRDLLYPGERPDTLRFKHGITRDVIYNSIGLSERVRTHLRVATLIRSTNPGPPRDEHLELLAYHSHEAADYGNAAYYAELAGHKAMSALALDRARTQYAAALAALDLLAFDDDVRQRWLAVAQRLGLACVYDPPREQLEIFRRAVELARHGNDVLTHARAEYWLAYVTYALGDVKAALRDCERARDVCTRYVEQAPEAPVVRELGALRIQVLAMLGQTHSAACQHDTALAELDHVLEARRRHKSGGRLSAGSAYTLACKGASLGDRGRFAEAHECLAEAREAVKGGDFAVRGSVLNWQAGLYLWQGRWSEAVATGLEAFAVANHIESLYIMGMAQCITGYGRWMSDRDTRAIDAMLGATAWLEARDRRLLISFNYGWLAEALADANRFAEARVFIARALRRAAAEDRFGEAMACRAAARLPPEWRSRTSEYYLTRAIGSAEARQSPHEIARTRLAQAQHAWAQGRRDDAERLRNEARAVFETLDMPWHAARAQELMTPAF